MDKKTKFSEIIRLRALLLSRKDAFFRRMQRKTESKTYRRNVKDALLKIHRENLGCHKIKVQPMLCSKCK